MTEQTKKAEIATVLGETLAKAIEFSYTWQTFDNPAEVREAGKWPNDAAILDFVNSNAERNALSSARATAMKSEAERISQTVEYRRRAYVENSVKQGLPRELAEGLAEQHIK